jgi:hypothetical protein
MINSKGLMHWNYPDFKEIYTAHLSNLASLLCGVPQELLCMVKMRYFRGTGMIFPRLALH